MTASARPDGLSDIEWLVALEEIRQLKARRDRYVDAHDWDAYEALHAPDHVSHHAPDQSQGVQAAPWTSAAEMMKHIKAAMSEGPTSITIHHSYDPEIVFETPTKARGIWAMTGASVHQGDDGAPEWRISYGYYYETYERRDGRWMFTTRRWHRYFGTGSDGVVLPLERVRGADAFKAFE